MRPTRFDDEATAAGTSLPAGVRVAIIGSTAFWHDESQETCTEIGRRLASVENITLLTGGVTGVGECTGRAFAEACRTLERTPRAFHILPRGCSAWDYGTTLFAGENMGERREILGRLAQVFIVVEGGPGTEHEAAVAKAHGAVLVPVGRSGGVAGALYQEAPRPPFVDARAWESLGDPDSPPRTVAEAAVEIVLASLRHRAAR